MTSLPPPDDVEQPVPQLVLELAAHLGEPAVVSLCVELALERLATRLDLVGER